MLDALGLREWKSERVCPAMTNTRYCIYARGTADEVQGTELVVFSPTTPIPHTFCDLGESIAGDHPEIVAGSRLDCEASGYDRSISDATYDATRAIPRTVGLTTPGTLRMLSRLISTSSNPESTIASSLLRVR